jgi:hypothetical protein
MGARNTRVVVPTQFESKSRNYHFTDAASTLGQCMLWGWLIYLIAFVGLGFAALDVAMCHFIPFAGAVSNAPSAASSSTDSGFVFDVKFDASAFSFATPTPTSTTASDGATTSGAIATAAPDPLTPESFFQKLLDADVQRWADEAMKKLAADSELKMRLICFVSRCSVPSRL